MTRENSGQRLAIVLDGQALLAPIVSFGSDAPREQIDDVIGRMHAAVTALPATQPAARGTR
ncbi:MAG TPA: hypothetical protein VER17_01615 [Tepidisphaeraceae bacterium]|nr:hypothetical protein [Tepidisphaeraceae bacterium]